MCAWRQDAGVSGFIEPEIAVMLLELIMTEGSLNSSLFLTNINTLCA